MSMQLGRIGAWLNPARRGVGHPEVITGYQRQDGRLP
jgi:hypothetical protein